MPQLAPSLNATKQTATQVWYQANRDRYPSALIPDWRAGTAEDGAPRLTAQVIGEHAQDALHRFAADYSGHQAGPGDTKPVYEYRPGRVVCVWRTGGVWVELWHHDLPAVPASTPAVMPKSRPSGRLPFPSLRRLTTPKEN